MELNENREGTTFLGVKHGERGERSRWVGNSGREARGE